eukprot:493789-Amphidinium_carterae.1
MEEEEEDVASFTPSCLKKTSRVKLSWSKTKTGRRRARRLGSGVTESSLPTIQEEKACDAFLDRISDAAHEDLQRRRLDDIIIFTSTLQPLSGPGCRSSDTSGASLTRMR